MSIEGLIVIAIALVIMLAREYLRRVEKAHEEERQARKAQRKIFVDCFSGTCSTQYEEKTLMLTDYTISNQTPDEIVIRSLGAYLRAEKLTFRKIFSGTIFDKFEASFSFEGQGIHGGMTDQISSPLLEKLWKEYGDKSEVIFINPIRKEKVKNECWISLKPKDVVILQQVLMFPKDALNDATSLEYEVYPGITVNFHNNVSKKCLSRARSSPCDYKIAEIVSEFIDKFPEIPTSGLDSLKQQLEQRVKNLNYLEEQATDYPAGLVPLELHNKIENEKIAVNTLKERIRTWNT